MVSQPDRISREPKGRVKNLTVPMNENSQAHVNSYINVVVVGQALLQYEGESITFTHVQCLHESTSKRRSFFADGGIPELNSFRSRHQHKSCKLRTTPAQ